MSTRHTNSIIVPILAVLACALLMACTSTQTERTESSVTVEALLPTSQPTQPPARQTNTPPAETAEVQAPTDAPAPTDTVAPPTFTPRPPPTYTPRPVPQQPTETDRPAGAPFQAQLPDGTLLSLADTRGTPTLLAFWAPW